MYQLKLLFYLLRCIFVIIIQKCDEISFGNLEGFPCLCNWTTYRYGDILDVRVVVCLNNLLGVIGTAIGYDMLVVLIRLLLNALDATRN